MTIHATAVAINGRAVLLRGASGAGKSDVALRLLTLPADSLHAFGVSRIDCALVADDRVELTRLDGVVSASAPDRLRGMLEIRGIGIVPVGRVVLAAPVGLVVDLDAEVERLPAAMTVDLHGLPIRRVALRAFDASTSAKIALALLHVPMLAPGPSK